MKNLISYEEFLNENEKSIGFDGSELFVGSSVISFEGNRGVITNKGTDGTVTIELGDGSHQIKESSELIEDEFLNEDLTWWEVTKGILAADAIKAGISLAGGGLLIAGYVFSSWRKSIAKKIETIRKDTKYDWLKTEAAKIADKFNADPKLHGMLADLSKYPYKDTSFIKGKRDKEKANANNKERSRIMREISKYVKSQLTDEEKSYFTEVNKILRDKPLSDNEGNKLEEDVRMIGTGTNTPKTTDSTPMTPGTHNTEDPSSGGSTFFR